MTNTPASFENLEPLINDAVNAGRLLEIAIDGALGRNIAGVPQGLTACTNEQHESILFALNTLNKLLELSEQGWRLAYDAEQARSKARAAA